MKKLTEQKPYEPRKKFKSVFYTAHDTTYEEIAESFKVLKPKWYAH